MFRPVDRAAKSKGSVRSPSPHSSSEDEGKKKKFSVKKPFPLRGKALKKEPKTTSVVSPKPESKPAKQGGKPVKPDSRWAAPVFVGGENGKEEMRLSETEPKIMTRTLAIKCKAMCDRRSHLQLRADVSTSREDGAVVCIFDFNR